jgi:hypothetical protein
LNPIVVQGGTNLTITSSGVVFNAPVSITNGNWQQTQFSVVFNNDWNIGYPLTIQGPISGTGNIYATAALTFAWAFTMTNSITILAGVTFTGGFM